MILFCLPTKPALKFGIIHNNFQRSFQQRSLGIVRKNDLIRSQTEHSSCAAGRRSITCTRGGFPASIIIHYILIQRHKKPFSYSTLSFSLLSHSGLEKKKSCGWNAYCFSSISCENAIYTHSCCCLLFLPFFYKTRRGRVQREKTN